MKTYNRYIQKHFAIFMALAVFAMGMNTVYAQDAVTKATTDQQEDLEAIEGMVVDGVTQSPIAGVRVEALDNKWYTAMTKEDGAFSIKLPKHVVYCIFLLQGMRA